MGWVMWVWGWEGYVGMGGGMWDGRDMWVYVGMGEGVSTVCG